MKRELIFSPEDADLALKTWRFDKWGYARRNHRRKPLNPIAIRAHHDVCLRAFGRRPDYSKGEVCDHINRNKLDNRRENLRIVSVSENNWNKERKCEFKYTTRHKCGKYQAQFSLNGRTVYVGLFSTPEEAVAARTKAKNEALSSLDGIPKSARTTTEPNEKTPCPRKR